MAIWLGTPVSLSLAGCTNEYYYYYYIGHSPVGADGRDLGALDLVPFPMHMALRRRDSVIDTIFTAGN